MIKKIFLIIILAFTTIILFQQNSEAKMLNKFENYSSAKQLQKALNRTYVDSHRLNDVIQQMKKLGAEYEYIDNEKSKNTYCQWERISPTEEETQQAIKDLKAKNRYDIRVNHYARCMNYPYEHHVFRYIVTKDNLSLLDKLKGIQQKLIKITIKSNPDYNNKFYIPYEFSYRRKRLKSFTVVYANIYKNFKFQKYDTSEQAQEVLNYLHPVGSDVDEVTNILNKMKTKQYSLENERTKDIYIYNAGKKILYKDSIFFIYEHNVFGSLYPREWKIWIEQKNNKILGIYTSYYQGK